MAGPCEHGNEPSVSVKDGEIFSTSCVTVSFSTPAEVEFMTQEALELLDVSTSVTFSTYTFPLLGRPPSLKRSL